MDTSKNARALAKMQEITAEISAAAAKHASTLCTNSIIICKIQETTAVYSARRQSKCSDFFPLRFLMKITPV
jgi:hypothetical protein